jgi:hypothetical protein
MNPSSLSTHVNGDSSPLSPLTLEQKIELLTQRIEKLEAEQSRFSRALFAAGQFIFTNPAAKMVMMSLPKEAQIRLKEYFANGI